MLFDGIMKGIYFLQQFHYWTENQSLERCQTASWYSNSLDFMVDAWELFFGFAADVVKDTFLKRLAKDF